MTYVYYQNQRFVIMESNSQLTFPSFAPSMENSPKMLQQSTSQSQNSVNIHKFSIHLPQEFLQQCYHSSDNNIKSQSNVKVYCRLRPSPKVIDWIKYDTTMLDDGQNRYSFDYIFGKLSTQEEMFAGIAKRHIDEFLNGNNSTIFAYGQTGSGKTYTMFGSLENQKQFGIIPRSIDQIFQKDITDSVITCSLIQIYNQKINDLLNPNQNFEIKIKEKGQGVSLEGIAQVCVENSNELLTLVKLGHKSRKTAATLSNDVSSRSHTILFLYRNWISKGIQKRCKLCFIDLAGSQKIRKSGAQGQTLEQAKKINLSLSCLCNVVHALTNGSDHIPYRNSKLTRILKDSLRGDTKTSLVTTCSLDKADYQETLSTIKFAIRAKKIKNKKRLNFVQVTMQQMVESLKKQLAATKEELAWYKRKQQQQKVAIQDIPQQSIDLLELKSLSFGTGVSSRMRLCGSMKSQ